MEPRRAPISALAIEHIAESSPPAFKLTRLPDGKSLAPLSIASPYDALVPYHPKPLMAELQWYLESFLDYPFPPEVAHAEHILEGLKLWGAQAFNTLFDRRDAGSWLSSADILQIRSDSANVLSWPWEALFDPQTGAFLAQQHRVERRLNALPDPQPLGEWPGQHINVLLVVARPYQGDVRYRSIARPLVEMVRARNLPAEITVLRPPTFDNLREHLQRKPNHYHVLHFDGHGAFGVGGGELATHRFNGPEGRLIFEDESGNPDPKSAADLSALLRNCAVPTVVLNACQSASLNEKAENPFSTVAAALLRTGMRSVVAMTYSLYVSGAQQFLPAFYRNLFESGQVAEAVRAGRQQMLSNKKRISPRGLYDFQDWLLPVLYQQAPLDFAFAASAEQKYQPSRLPKNVIEHVLEYGFIGRDSAILDMERALHRKAPCILIEGLGGVGKTTLARGFLRWLDDTNGLDGALWFDFREIRTFECVINRIGEKFHGENFGVASNKLDLLLRAFQRFRVIVVWDNFESAAENLSSADRSELDCFVGAIYGKLGKIIITSRSSEEWLPPSRRFRLSLGGLDGEERWEFCDTVVNELGLDATVDRNDPELQKLLDQLAGHPLAMRVVLPKLERMPAAAIVAALRTNIAELGLSGDKEQGRLFGTLRFVEQGLSEQLRPLLQLVCLHESYLDANLLGSMAEQVNAEWDRHKIDQLMAALGGAGLIKDLGQAVYELHPLLTSYLRSTTVAATEVSERAFVNVMAVAADHLVRREAHEQLIPFKMHHSNLRSALTLARKHSQHVPCIFLTQLLARNALDLRQLNEASRLYSDLTEIPEWNDKAAGYHQLGRIAQLQRNFATAYQWYLKSLAISERDGDWKGAAITYYQLGRVAEERRDFANSREWCRKSLEIEEQQGNWRGVAFIYRQLGTIAREERDYVTARDWYLKSVEISERESEKVDVALTYHELGVMAECQGDLGRALDWYLKSLRIKEHLGDQLGAARTYHHLGTIMLGQRKFVSAREFYVKSLAISERESEWDGAASTYHQLGRAAIEEGDFAVARGWQLKALAIKEQQADQKSVGSTYDQMGILEGLEGNLNVSLGCFIKAIHAFLEIGDQHSAATSRRNLLAFYAVASEHQQLQIKELWEEAGLGPLQKGSEL